ncbi:hypothetical protein [uncultured Actinobacillus sp.]|uniref:hypothetical protein n=1 Tax=uncultured Actinobacillus sp. TaxID=417616 RepID=UPI0025F44FBB|nr:hypothetical protein [uncultured Actinobacillus sp.]
MSKDWNDFEEEIDHELRECDKLGKRGHRVDEKRGYSDGIRNYSQISQHLANSSVKSCDYFLINSNKGHFYCLEFSDLLEQKKLSPKIPFKDFKLAIRGYLKLEDTPRSAIKKITKITDPDSIIKAELIDKIRDTDLLIKYIYDDSFSRITNLPERDLEKYFFIVYKGDGSSDSIRIFDDMLSSMKISSLNKTLCSLNNSKIKPENIFFLELEEFKSRYC